MIVHQDVFKRMKQMDEDHDPQVQYDKSFDQVGRILILELGDCDLVCSFLTNGSFRAR